MLVERAVLVQGPMVKRTCYSEQMFVWRPMDFTYTEKMHCQKTCSNRVQLQQRIIELEQCLISQQHNERQRLALLSEGIRQQLSLIVNSEMLMGLAGDANLTKAQREVLQEICHCGQNILELVQLFCENAGDRERMVGSGNEHS